jgi:hypothetical protein
VALVVEANQPQALDQRQLAAPRLPRRALIFAAGLNPDYQRYDYPRLRAILRKSASQEYRAIEVKHDAVPPERYRFNSQAVN